MNLEGREERGERDRDRDRDRERDKERGRERGSNWERGRWRGRVMERDPEAIVFDKEGASRSEGLARDTGYRA